MVELYSGEDLVTLAYIITVRDDADDVIKTKDAAYPGI